MKFYTSEKIGETRELTPEGFLLCRRVPIARTGEMLYRAKEVPVEAGRDGIIRIYRDADDLFAPDTIASFAGKPVTLDHPDEDVTPDNWDELSAGVVMDPRRGEGDMADCIVADLLITKASAIAAVRDGMREVSCGYDADYEQVEPGRGRQRNIIGNHVALVKDGRCGPRCSIGDKDMTKKRSWKDRVLRAFKYKDEDLLNEALESAPDTMDEHEEGEGQTHRLVIEVAPKGEEKLGQEGAQDEGEPDPYEERFARIEASIATLAEAVGKLSQTATADEEGEEEEAKTEDGEEEEEGTRTDDEDEIGGDDPLGEAARTSDSAGLKDEFQDLIARAEILSPGIKLATYDAAMPRKKMRDNMCAMRRKALGKALADEVRGKIVRQAIGVSEVTRMTCDAVGVAFIAGSEAVKTFNNGRRGLDIATRDQSKVAITPLAEINRRNREFWGSRK
ncbi:hypothetical protein GGR16_002402 [Chelatococcus caeni]|uniref:DUF2213 domain-containing protein n=1 Tax=Chelatococcus caeni TaxID=1348468 RepID=A0A840BXU5_9HYPH|nr:DUF2213 domain-containing protein [Chelatococcus caeni]MBB4017373.1 hypothetical protein [Chelatococcus caeni]